MQSTVINLQDLAEVEKRRERREQCEKELEELTKVSNQPPTNGIAEWQRSDELSVEVGPFLHSYAVPQDDCDHPIFGTDLSRMPDGATLAVHAGEAPEAWCATLYNAKRLARRDDKEVQTCKANHGKIADQQRQTQALNIELKEKENKAAEAIECLRQRYKDCRGEMTARKPQIHDLEQEKMDQNSVPDARQGLAYAGYEAKMRQHLG